MFGTCQGLVVVAVPVVDVDTDVVVVTSGVHSCPPAVSSPVIVAPARPLPGAPPAPPFSVPDVSVDVVSVALGALFPPPAPNERTPLDDCRAGGREQEMSSRVRAAMRRTSGGTPAREWFASRAR